MPPYALLTEIEPARDDGKKPSASPSYKSTQFLNLPPLQDMTTLYEVFSKSVNKYSSNNCLGHRKVVDGKAGEYVWWTYEKTGAKVQSCAAGLVQAGTASGARVGVFGPNCPEWMVTMQACNRMTWTTVPLYDTLGDSAIEYIMSHAEISTVVCLGEKLPILLEALPKVKKLMKCVVYWGSADEASIQGVKDLGIAIYSFDELLKLGNEKPADPVPPKPEDLCTIMYTSGTTGDPKGVMLTHAACVSLVGSTKYFLDANVSLDENDVFLSYLPLAHIFDRVTEELFIFMGASIGYWQGNIKTLFDDIGCCRPSLFVGVPRVFDRIYAGVMAQVNSGSYIKKTLFNWGYNRKLAYMKSGIASDKASPFFDSLVFSKLKQKIGGQVKLIVSGGAPLAAHTEEFLRVCFCCHVAQGYGLTETCAGSLITCVDQWDHFGTVGIPTPVTEVRLESVPEMNYDALADEPKGEILLRGPNNFTGYYKNKQGTDEVLESDGWFHTGDVGTIIGDGVVKIIDRKKNIFKLSQGEYVPVETVEEVYKKCSAIDQIWVYGNSFESFLVAVVVPQEAYVKTWGSKNGKGSDVAKLINDSDLSQTILREMTTVAKDGNLKGFMMVKAIHLDSEPFSVEKDTLTPTFKLRRPQLQKMYQEEIDKMYAAAK